MCLPVAKKMLRHVKICPGEKYKLLKLRGGTAGGKRREKEGRSGGVGGGGG